jgi:hypothetical protein
LKNTLNANAVFKIHSVIIIANSSQELRAIINEIIFTNHLIRNHWLIHSYAQSVLQLRSINFPDSLRPSVLPIVMNLAFKNAYLAYSYHFTHLKFRHLKTFSTRNDTRIVHYRLQIENYYTIFPLTALPDEYTN